MGLFSFGTPKTLPATQMKKVIEKMGENTKTANASTASLYHDAAAALAGCGYKCLPDSSWAEAVVREIHNYGMPREKDSMGIVGWWYAAETAERGAPWNPLPNACSDYFATNGPKFGPLTFLVVHLYCPH